MSTRLVALFLVALLTAQATPAKQYERVFVASHDKVWEACVAIAKEKYTVVEVNREGGFVTFWTGYSLTSNGFQVTVIVEKKSDSETLVSIRPAKRQQLFAWGAGGRIAEKYFKQLAERLAVKSEASGRCADDF